MLQERLEVRRNLAYHHPREVAKLLGKLVFCSQVIEHGRCYMQAMLGAFKGWRVDWRRGLVSSADGVQQRLRLEPGFWRDLEWFRDHLPVRHCIVLDAPRLGEAAVTGTDASDWGCGALVWMDGQREENVFKFSAAEQRRPINWRELLGILRILERWGPRLRGRHLLIESDSFVAA